MRAWLLAIVLAVIAIAPVFLLTYYYDRRSPQPSEQEIASVQFEPEKVAKKLEPGAKFPVKACKVLDGYRFEMYLDGGKWIEAHLAAVAKEEASPVVVDWLNKTTPPPPTVTLLRQVGDHWVVDFELNVDGKRASLIDLLRARGLLF